MLIPSEKLGEELSRSRDLARFFQAGNGTSMSSGLVIKSTSLDLKLLIVRKKIEVLLYQRAGDNRLVYVVRLDQGDAEPIALWSPVESLEELEAICAALRGSQCDIHLFNEADVDVCWAACHMKAKGEDLKRIAAADITPVAPVDEQQLDADIDEVLQSLSAGESPQGLIAALSPATELSWQEQFNHYITNRLAVCALSIITGNEGAQQEEIGLWLIDELSPTGAIKNPQVQEPKRTRELCDLLLTYSGGVILFESKTLSVLDRDEFPTRARLVKSAVKNSRKAVGQLAGACKNIMNGFLISESDGTRVQIERRRGCHCVILVPDLTLLDNCTEFGGGALRQFQKDAGGFLQWLDLAEMRVIAGTARHMSGLDLATSPMMAFDALLFKRWKAAMTCDDPNLEFRMNLVDA